MSYELERLVGRSCCALLWTTTLPSGDTAVVEERRTPGDPAAVSGWLEQARMTHSVGLTAVYAVQPHAQGALVAREPMPGETLEQILVRVGRFDSRSVSTVAAALAGSLAMLHYVGLAHGAPEPERVCWLTDPRIVLGLPPPHRWDPSAWALCVHADPKRVARTPPERLDGADPDTRSDVFGWAATLVELASGVPPFLVVDDAPATARRVAHTVPAGVDWIVDPVLRGVIIRALSKDPDLRPADARAVQAELADAAPATAATRALGATDTGPPAPPPVGPDRVTRRWRRATAVTALLAVVATVVLIAALLDGRPQAGPELVRMAAPDPLPTSAPEPDQEDGNARTVQRLVEVTATPCGHLHEEPGGTQTVCLPAGVLLPVVGERNGWVEIAEADASSAGWVAANDVNVPDEP